MRALVLAPFLVLVLLASGCAGHGMGPEAARGVAPCLPTEVSSQFFFWPVVAFRSINLLTEDGEAVPGSWVLYRKGKTSVAAMWINSDLVAVDPSPETDAPEWVDLSLVTPLEGKLVLRSNPEAPCRWKHWDHGERAAASALSPATLLDTVQRDPVQPDPVLRAIPWPQKWDRHAQAAAVVAG